MSEVAHECTTGSEIRRVIILPGHEVGGGEFSAKEAAMKTEPCFGTKDD